MLLSEAIRAGAGLTYPVTGELFDGWDAGSPLPTRACALGCALVGFSQAQETPLWPGMDTDRAAAILSELTGIDLEHRYISMPEAYWTHRNQEYQHPHNYPVVEAIWRMNDRSAMSRQKIADYLASLGL